MIKNTFIDINHYVFDPRTCPEPYQDSSDYSVINLLCICSISSKNTIKSANIEYWEVKMSNGDVFYIDKDSKEKLNQKTAEQRVCDSY